jgi:hypothetical protein
LFKGLPLAFPTSLTGTFPAIVVGKRETALNGDLFNFFLFLGELQSEAPHDQRFGDDSRIGL